MRVEAGHVLSSPPEIRRRRAAERQRSRSSSGRVAAQGGLRMTPKPSPIYPFLGTTKKPFRPRNTGLDVPATGGTTPALAGPAPAPPQLRRGARMRNLRNARSARACDGLLRTVALFTAHRTASTPWPRIAACDARLITAPLAHLPGLASTFSVFRSTVFFVG